MSLYKNRPDYKMVNDLQGKLIPVGITDEHNVCDCCGKVNLKRTVVMQNPVFTHDNVSTSNEYEEFLFFGTNCFKKFLNRKHSSTTVKSIKKIKKLPFEVQLTMQKDYGEVTYTYVINPTLFESYAVLENGQKNLVDFDRILKNTVNNAVWAVHESNLPSFNEVLSTWWLADKPEILNQLRIASI